MVNGEKQWQLPLELEELKHFTQCSVTAPSQPTHKKSVKLVVILRSTKAEYEGCEIALFTSLNIQSAIKALDSRTKVTRAADEANKMLQSMF